MRSVRFALPMALLLVATASQAQPVAPGYSIATHASVADPMRLAFDPSGVLYVGRDDSGSGGGPGDAVRIHRISADGSSVTEFGATTIADPDAVCFDGGGVLGVGGAVLVGGQISNAAGGHLSAVEPDETVSVLFGPTTAFHNPTDFVIDGSGRLLFTNATNPGTSSPGVYWTSGALPVALFTTTANPSSIAVDGSDRIYATFTDGTLRVYSDAGALVDGTFATALGSGRPMTIGSLGGAASAIYVVDDLGDLLRIDFTGTQTVIGTGFVDATDLAVGPDGALYVAEFTNDRVLRVAPLAAAVPAVQGAPYALLVLAVCASGAARVLRARRAGPR